MLDGRLSGRQQFDDKGLADRMLQSGHLSAVPNKSDDKGLDDKFSINYARSTDGYLVSNDNFNDHRAGDTEMDAFLRQRLVKYTFVEVAGIEFMPDCTVYRHP
jgi:hypothetical protein